LGENPGQIDGVDGPLTKAAITNVRNANVNAYPDFSVDQLGFAAAVKAKADALTDNSQDVIASVEVHLRRAADTLKETYDVGSSSGANLDPKSVAAIKAFQRKHGLVEDGKATVPFLKKLVEIVNS